MSSFVLRPDHAADGLQVKRILRQNVNNVVESGERVDRLEERAGKERVHVGVQEEGRHGRACRCAGRRQAWQSI